MPSGLENVARKDDDMRDDLIQQPELPEDDVRKPLTENIDALEFFRTRIPKATIQFQNWMEYPSEIRRTNEPCRKLFPASRETYDKSSTPHREQVDRQPRNLGDFGPRADLWRISGGIWSIRRCCCRQSI
jgi:hypothetical protein